MCPLPAELILKILYKSDPRDVVRWRTVSKWFHDIACDDLLWRALYTDSPFPRPPGPSSSQSGAYLERMLLKSARLARSWTTQPLREVLTANIKLGQPLATTPTKLISGRWLVGCEGATRFVLHDADPRAKARARKVLWEHEEPMVSAWDVHSVSSVVGQSIVYVLLKLHRIEPGWKLLEFRLNDESGEIYDSATIEPPPWAWNTLSMVKLHGGKPRFLFIPTEDPRGVVFDTQTRVFYALPQLRVALEDTFPVGSHLSPLVDFRMEFSNTHIISLCCSSNQLYGPAALIQVFVIPSDESLVQEGKPILRLTHEGISKYPLLTCSVMQPCVDSITGATTIRFLSSMEYRKIKCIDLILPKTSGLEVARMTTHDGPVIRFQVERGHTEDMTHINVHGNTHLRAFIRARPSQHPTDPMENLHIMKFTVDMRQDPCTVTCSQMVPAKWSHAADLKGDLNRRHVVFDGFRGRLCYVHHEVKDEVVVVEIE